MHHMSRGSRRALCPLALLGLLAGLAQGCGGGANSKESGGANIPPAVQESNKNMQDFMNAKKSAAKKR